MRPTQVRLYDGKAKAWRAVTVDDMLPVEKATGTLQTPHMAPTPTPCTFHQVHC